LLGLLFWVYIIVLRLTPTPRFSSRALGQLLRLSKATFAGAFHQAPKVQDVALVTSQSDDAVSDFVTSPLMGLWRKKGVRFASMDFPKAMKIERDMMDPSQKNQQTDSPVQTLMCRTPCRSTPARINIRSIPTRRPGKTGGYAAFASHVSSIPGYQRDSVERQSAPTLSSTS
jgi:hypothetical protein